MESDQNTKLYNLRRSSEDENDEKKLTQKNFHDDDDDDKSHLTLKFIDLLPQIFASCTAYLLVMQAGISMSFSSVLITQLADTNDISLDAESAGWLASIWSLSLPIGALSSGYFMDRYGRKRTILILCIPFTLAWLLVSMAQNLTMIYLSRTLLGICTGLTTASVVYVSEISSNNIRSGLLCMNSVWVSLGIFTTYAFNGFNLHWRTISYIYAAMSFCCMFAVYAIPESPQWILAFNKRDNDEKAGEKTLQSLNWFYRDKRISQRMFHEIVTKKKNSTDAKDTAFTLNNFMRRQVVKPFLILIVLFLLQQFCGGYILIFYTLNIFRNLGSEFLRTIDERVALILVGLIRLIMAIIAALTAHKCKRKFLLCISSIGMGLGALIAAGAMMTVKNLDQSLFLKRSLTSENITLSEAESASQNFSNYVILTSVLIYILFASLGILIIPWTLISEMFSIRHKAKCGGLVVAFAYVLMALILKGFPVALEVFSLPIIFMIFGTACLLTTLYVILVLPETHQKSFEEIEKHYIK